MTTRYGRINIAAGLWVMVFFMLYGFLLIYWRDFGPGKEQWIASYNDGAHFESRLAHVHGNLFALLNIAFGLVLLNLKVPETLARWASWLALGGLLMPLGILSEVYLNFAPVLVIVGGVSITAATVTLAIGAGKAKQAA